MTRTNGVPILDSNGKAVGRVGNILQPTGDGRMMGISLDDNSSPPMPLMSMQSLLWRKFPAPPTQIRVQNHTRDDIEAKLSFRSDGTAMVTITRGE